MAVITKPRITNTDPNDKRGIASGKFASGKRVDVLPQRTYGNKR